MIKWEYKTSALTATELNKEGLAGWELVCCTSMNYVFKRALLDDAPFRRLTTLDGNEY
jgi:hypothetical protein